jgi:tetratricopeptide (TPR) repeat protein
MARAYNNRGVIYHDHKNDLARALTDYTRAIELDARNDIARSNRSHIHYEYRDYGKAFADADAALDINPFNSSAWNVRGWVLQQKDPAAAVNNYNQAIEFVPNNAVLFANRGRALSKVKDGLAKAVDDYSKAIELDRNYHWAYLYRGQAYESVNSLNGQNDYKRALELHPKHDATIKKFLTMHLRIINEANEPIKVFWSFKPGEAAFLLDGDWKLTIRRVRLWAVGENSGGSNTTYRNNPLWLAPEAGYLATSHMTYTYRFGGKQ